MLAKRILLLEFHNRLLYRRMPQERPSIAQAVVSLSSNSNIITVLHNLRPTRTPIRLGADTFLNSTGTMARQLQLLRMPQVVYGAITASDLPRHLVILCICQHSVRLRTLQQS